MQRKMIVLVMGLFLLILGGTGIAMGADQQVAGQAADSSQSATSSATSTQTNPSNQNVDVRIFSPGDAGAVSQTNSSAAASAAANANATDQSAQQQQAGGGSGTQAVGQDAASTQAADSQATSTQTDPSNSNISVRIDSPGKGGAVTQTNSSTAQSAAGNLNKTKQTSTQQQSGGACCTAGGTQAAGQAATNDQTATSDATSTQKHPSNTNIGVRIGSPGDDGAVTQTNSSTAESVAANLNKTKQTSTQQQSGGACCAGGGTQVAGQAASNTQDANSTASSTQKGASNVNTPVRIFSPGDNGAVTQTNASAAASGAVNLNGTDQSATQTQAGGECCKDPKAKPTDPKYEPKDPKYEPKGDTCCHGGTGVQAIGQFADSDQTADSSATSTQTGASNTNTPVRIGSKGDAGKVEQTNASIALSAALNANETDQAATQTQGGGGYGTGVQAIGQKADSSQTATSEATSTQYHPSNTNTPVRIGSYGDDGDVSQTNLSLAASLAANHNGTDQSATQTQAGGECCKDPKAKPTDPKYEPKDPKYQPKGDTCCHGGTGVQAIGQFADSDQTADSSATSTQTGASNTNTPVRIGSKGDAGKVEQTNLSLAASLALNVNWLKQYAVQQQGGVI